MDSRLYAAHQLFKRNGYLLEWLKLSVKKKWSAVWTARDVHAKKIVIRLSGSGNLFEKVFSCLSGSSYLSVQNKIVLLLEQLRLSVWKKLSAVRTAWAIRSKKIGDCSKARSSYLFKEKFSWVSVPEQFPRQPLVSNDLLFSRYSWVVPLWTTLL